MASSLVKIGVSWPRLSHRLGNEGKVQPTIITDGVVGSAARFGSGSHASGFAVKKCSIGTLRSKGLFWTLLYGAIWCVWLDYIQ